MATVSEVLKRYEALDARKVAYEVASAHEEELIDIQKDQLWAGKNLQGDDLTPSILDDPYFLERARNAKAKDVQATAKKMAQAWSDYKDTQQQWGGNPEFGERRKGYANLIFTSGMMVWNPLRVVASGQTLRIATEPNIQRDIEQKYGAVFGLNPVGVRYFNEHYFRKPFFERLRRQLRR
jgi:hypothetical protein